MTNEEAIEELRDASYREVRYGDKDNHYDKIMKRVEAFDMAIKALEQQPCENCISRDAVEKITWEEPSYDDALNVLTEVRDKVRALPSVKPEIKWIPVSEKLPNRGDTVFATFQSPVTGMPFVATTHIVREPKEVVKDSNIIAWMPIMKPYKEKKE